MPSHGATARRRAFLQAEWRQLVMLNYDADPDLLRPLVPAGTALDVWHGRALVSIVGFRFLRTRVLGVPVPFHRDFDEVNLRFYVRREMPDGEVRRGVTFVRELVPRRAIALVARLAYDEPYRAVPMRSRTPPPGTPGRVAYEWRLPRDSAWQHVAAASVGAATVPAAGDEAAFVTEHYWGYTRQRDGGTVEYEVAHPRWRVWAAESPELVADVASLYGPAFVATLGTPPASTFVADGSAVTVFQPRRLDR
ncbi:MAG: DUF2071 domain-containing protein [Gemmatirosa sp.]|nr:DUF2071 domain-containing protein [Gemmatirosa sp.]